jgi:uncharacterized protein (DUF2141 family)
MKKLILIVLALIITSGVRGAEIHRSLHVKVSGLRSPDGWVVCHLFNSEDGYPTKSKKSLKFINDFELKDSIAEFVFYDLPPGEYAFTVHHDENGNKKMDKNFFGLPSEGWACSNNASVFLGMGVPSYKDAKFEVGKEETKQLIEINY